MQNVNIGGRICKSNSSTRLQSSDTDALYKVGPEMLEKIAKLPGLRDVTGDLYVKNPSERIADRPRGRGGLWRTQDQIRQELYDCFGAAPGGVDVHSRSTTIT